MKAWLTAVAAAVVGYITPIVSVDVDQAMSDAAGTIAYAALAKAPALPAPKPAPTPPPKVVREEAAPKVAPESPATPAAKATPTVTTVKPTVAAPARQLILYPRNHYTPTAPQRWRR
jgi:hypothetical protein